MDEMVTSWAALDSAPVGDASTAAEAHAVYAPLEFVGSSDHTIAEAVRRALSHASMSLQTLEGAGVMVIPEIERRTNAPRFRVTLRVSPQGIPPDASRS